MQPSDFERLQRLLAKIEDTRLVGQIAFEVADPRDALALEIALQAAGKSRPVTRHRQGRAGIAAGLHREQEREIRHIARHRPEHAHRGQPGVARVRRHEAEAGAKPEDVVPAGRIAQASAVVAAVGDRQHAQRERDRGAAAAAAGGPRLIVGVAGRAIDGIVGVRAQAEFGHVGLADEDRAGAAHPLHHDAISRRNEVREDARAHRHRHALDGREILHGEREAVQRPPQLAARQLCIALARLRQQGGAVLQRDDGVDPRVEPLDVVEMGGHDLDARDAPRADRRGQADRIHHDDVGRRSRRQCQLAAIGSARHHVPPLGLDLAAKPMRLLKYSPAHGTLRAAPRAPQFKVSVALPTSGNGCHAP